jgi:hypothetical protein
MTTVQSAIHPTAIDVLFGSPVAEPAVDVLFSDRSLLGSVTTANHLSKNTSEALQHEVSVATQRLLDFDLVDVMVRAWQVQTDLLAAARRTAHAPGHSEIVELVTHQVTSQHKPYIDLSIDDVPIGRIQLELELIFNIRAALAVVQSGALVAVRCGDFSVDASLAIEGEPVASRRASFDLPAEVKLGEGIPLLRNEPPARPTPLTPSACVPVRP